MPSWRALAPSLAIVALLVVLPSLAVLGCGAAGAPSASPSSAPSAVAPAGSAAHGRHGVHGMIVVGRGRVFLSHIPTLRPPHDFQIILEARWSEGRADVPESFDDGLYTLEPEPFSLDELRTGRLRTFHGDLYRGNFEDGGARIATGVGVSVARVVFVRALAPMPPPESPEAGATTRYVLFGAPETPYSLRLVTGPDDVDQIVRVTSDVPWADADLAAAPVRPFPATPRLRVGDGAFGLRVVREVSCLRGPDFSRPCS